MQALETFTGIIRVPDHNDLQLLRIPPVEQRSMIRNYSYFTKNLVSNSNRKNHYIHWRKSPISRCMKWRVSRITIFPDLPLTSHLFIFSFHVFFIRSIIYVTKRKRVRCIIYYTIYSCMIYIFIHFHCAKSKKKKKLFTYFYTLQWRNNNAKFFFQLLQANMGRQQRLFLHIFIYISI